MVLDRGHVGVLTGVDQDLGIEAALDVNGAQQLQPQRAGHDLGQCPRGAIPQSHKDGRP